MFRVVVLAVAAIVLIKSLIAGAHSSTRMIATVGMVVWVAAMAHVVLNRFPTVGTKLHWFAVVLFLPVVGAIVYFRFGRPKNAPPITLW